MQKTVEVLIEKHISKVVYQICFDIVRDRFDEAFSQSKAHPDKNDTTVGQTTRILERLSKESVDIKLGEMMNEITDEMGLVKQSPTNNPFSIIAYSLWEDFLYYYDIRGYVESAVSEECDFRFNTLRENGIIDFEGDYTGI